jgi:hypothetical protein
MSWSKKVITAILKECPEGERAADFVTDQLQELDRIKDGLEWLYREQEKIENEYKEAVKALDARKQKFQIQCPHYETSYQSDPAGGRDSCNVCELCRECF